MYKTTWLIKTNDDKDLTTKFTYYHFGKQPKFPGWYFEEGNFYEVEVLTTFKLVNTIKMFWKCLTKAYEGVKF